MNEGFLGTAAPRCADVVLLLEIGMGVALLIGAMLARVRRFRLHAWCQSVIVLLNLVIIVLLMVPSFHDHVSPKLPLKLGKAYYPLATAHGALGSVTEIAGLYILLAAGTIVLPHKFRLTEYKPWMRGLLVLCGWFSFLDLQHMPAGMSRICRRNEFVEPVPMSMCQFAALAFSRVSESEEGVEGRANLAAPARRIEKSPHVSSRF